MKQFEPVKFTNSNSGLALTGAAASGWNPVGFLQTPASVAAGEGYGPFLSTGIAGVVGQGPGICLVLWPSDNTGRPDGRQGQASQLDLLESWDGTRTGFSTPHHMGQKLIRPRRSTTGSRMPT